MRKVKTIPADAIRFVVPIDDNADDPDPFYVMIRPLTAGEYDAFMRGAIASAGSDATTAEMLEGARKARTELISRCVVSVCNYVIGDRIPVDGASLVDTIEKHAPPSELAILDLIEEKIRTFGKDSVTRGN